MSDVSDNGPLAVIKEKLSSVASEFCNFNLKKNSIENQGVSAQTLIEDATSLLRSLKEYTFEIDQDGELKSFSGELEKSIIDFREKSLRTVNLPM